MDSALRQAQRSGILTLRDLQRAGRYRKPRLRRFFGPYQPTLWHPSVYLWSQVWVGYPYGWKRYNYMSRTRHHTIGYKTKSSWTRK